MRSFQKTDVGEIARNLARDTEGFCRQFFPEGRRVGNYWQMADTTGAKGQSLAVRLKSSCGKLAGKWTDHATGEHGDLLDLLEAHLGPIAFPTLLDTAVTYLGNRPVLVPSDAQHGSYPSGYRQRVAGRKLFSYARPIQGTLAERYLRGRRIGRFGASLAYHPSAYLQRDDGTRMECPALLAAINNSRGDITGCARTFLNARSAGLADFVSPKRVLGELYGNGIRLGPWRKATDLFVGEGLENLLSIGTVFPMAALTSCLTAAHLAGFRWPSCTERIWITHDNDDAGKRAARSLQLRAATAGLDAFLLCPDRDDFNSDLMEDGVTLLRHRLAKHISRQCGSHDLWPRQYVA